MVLECHNTGVIPFIGAADNADDKCGPLRVSLMEAIHQVAVLESGRKTVLGFKRKDIGLNATTKTCF